ncbi:hypothetical protein CC85DRAFT_303926 [Cutaneotrichosporon oleaginosum]|uniref:Uncharacterized protein n=1 Tax=Cutaneotrichosporon oleaginosum TaxID=879819 RepID=A0A0J0XI80_9TREE|nr:uncharacterized protein CC85DRAFT_303926 [Cutaneotrichosporon oleaginosum]KLT40717.1 hypothetical protein CC85DRAFT_303926 [Cutaneotrichosporon oleaginosum]TXT14234.1 hypothetical protein COLE_00427 [Cutaneotrichosporon oleaginosum]
MGIDNLRSVALICAMDHARLGQLPCTFRFLVEWGANRALSLVSWPNQTHTTVVSFLNQLSPRGGQRFTFWHFSQTAAQSHSLRMSAVPRLATFGGAFFPWVGGWHEWRVHDIPDYTQIVVHIWGPETPGYWPKVVVPDSDIGILEDIITGMLQLPRLSWCLVGVETIPPTQFGGLEKLSDDWALRREVLLHRFRTKTTANVKLLTRAEYCREFGGKRFILESGRPDTTDDPADIGSGFDLASRRWRP